MLSFFILNLSLLNLFEIEELSAPSPYHWRQRHEKQHDALVLELWGPSGRTEINFHFDFLNGSRWTGDGRLQGLIESQNVDSRLDLSVTTPGTVAWAPHPKSITSLEERFLGLASAVGYDLDPPSLFELNENGEVGFNRLADFIATQHRRRSQISFEEFYAAVERQVERSRRTLAPRASKFLETIVGSHIDALDIVQPIETGLGSDPSGYDAFALFPLEALDQYDERALDALYDLAARPDEYPLLWLVRAQEFPLAARISALMLITHNHRSEDLFVQGCLLRFGISKAWKAQKAINQIYLNERLFWLQNEELFHSRNINVAPKRLVLYPLFGIQPFDQQDLEHWVPFKNHYHYYGAFVAALRLKIEFALSDPLVIMTIKMLGRAYKTQTGGASKDQLSRIKRHYSQGARDALDLWPFLK